MTRKQIERRINSDAIQVRSNADGTVGVRGYAAVFDVEAHGEVIRSSAFNRTLAQRDNIRLLVNHEGVPLATTRSGTLEVGIDERGLWFDAPSLDMANPRVQELVSAMKRDDINQCSFAGYFTDVQRSNGIDEVREVKATDVSIVTYPWYDATEVGLTGERDVDRALLAVRSLTPEQRAMVWATVAVVVDTEDSESEDSEEVETDPVEEAPAEESDDSEDQPADTAPRTHKIADARALLARAGIAA